MRTLMGWMVAAALALAAFEAAAQSQSPTERFEQFLGSIAKDSDAATDKLFVGSQEEKISPKAVAALKARFKSTIGLYGKYLGYEKISDREFSPSLRRVTYLQKFESVPAIWVIYLYRPGPHDWLISSLNFVSTDQIGTILNGIP